MLQTTNNHDTSISIELLKALALCQHENTEYFNCDGKFYEGNETEKNSEWKEENTGLGMDAQLFSDWCADNLTEIKETDSDGEKDNYLILTDEEADEKCAEYIKDSLWAFNPSFLSGETGIDISVFEAIQSNGKCEDNNDAIESCIDDMDSFIESAISADGRGHFMNTYDGNENEETVLIDDETGEILASNDSAAHTFYIYRMN